jgi:1-acyl-sn-glycerol-3-phosphate acyltransferase
MYPMVFFLAALALSLMVLVIGFGWVVRSTQYNASQTFFWLLAKLLTRFLWRTRLETPFPLQGPGNAVIICNHRTSIDPFFVQVASRRVIHWMVAREYCDHPILGFFLRIAEVIPVNRGGIDTAATKAAIRLVSAGGMVGMLPEGRINDTDQFMRPVRPGAVLVALKGHAPIIPCYIEGAPYGGSVGSPFRMRARVRVRFGTPIDLSPYYGREKDDQLVRALLVQCVEAIAALAGRHDFQPQVAGRQWRGTDSDLQPGTDASASDAV